MSRQTRNTDSSAVIPLQRLDNTSHHSVSTADEHRSTTPDSHFSSHTPPPRHFNNRYGHYKSKLSRKHKTHQDWWTWELIGIATSGVSLAAMVSVLLYFDDKGRPKWSVGSIGITINSILSWTATIAKSAMLIPITECISQLKWVWFSERDRDLADMEYFDQGSRGPWGSLCLLVKLRARHLGALGAIITLVALAFDPSVQQIVRHGSRPVVVDDKTAVVSASKLYGYTTPGPESIVLSFRSAPLPIKAATYNGLFADHPSITPYFVCPSGNCNWADYSSLAVCSACQDVTSQLRVNCTTSCDARLPSGTSFSGSTGTVVSINASAAPLHFKNSTSKAHVLGLLQNIAAFRHSGAKKASDIVAAECMLYLCVRSYKSFVNNGKYDETFQKTWPDLNSSSEQILPESTDNEYFYTISGQKYGMGNRSFNEISRHISDLLEGTVVNRNGIAEFSKDGLQPIWDSSSFINPIHSIAATMTKVIRDSNNTTNSFPNGTVREQEIYISVQWKWLSLPIGLFLATAIQLALTIFRTRNLGAGVWRSSALALAFHGLDGAAAEDASARLGDSGVMSENDETLLKAAKGMRVRMVTLSDGSAKLRSADDIDAGERLLREPNH